jgi:hypothetical protein
MNLTERYIVNMTKDIANFVKKVRLSIRYIHSVNVYYISIDGESNVSDNSYALIFGINAMTYHSLLIKYGGVRGANSNINFEEEEDAKNARDAIAFYAMIERRLKNESN